MNASSLSVCHFTIFIATATRIDLAQVSMNPLTLPELWLFKIAVGRNANFSILGLMG